MHCAVSETRIRSQLSSDARPVRIRAWLLRAAPGRLAADIEGSDGQCQEKDDRPDGPHNRPVEAGHPGRAAAWKTMRVPSALRCWALSDGRAGMANQALGLAERLGEHLDLSIEQKTVRLPAITDKWPGTLLAAAAKARPRMFLAGWEDAGRKDGPWPDIAIACGRRTLPVMIALSRVTDGRCFTIQTQDPRIDPDLFSAVVPPRHDGLTGSNVEPMTGAPNRITRAGVAAAGAPLAAALGALPRPRIAALIGGPSKAYGFDLKDGARIVTELARLARQGMGLMITTSRRTPAETAVLVRDRLRPLGAFVWTGAPEDGPNPYPGLFAHADCALVTAESTNMLTDAASAGIPTYILPLSGGNAKFSVLHHDLVQRGLARPFQGVVEQWPMPEFDETGRVAARLAARLARAGGQIDAAMVTSGP